MLSIFCLKTTISNTKGGTPLLDRLEWSQEKLRCSLEKLNWKMEQLMVAWFSLSVSYVPHPI